MIFLMLGCFLLNQSLLQASVYSENDCSDIKSLTWLLGEWQGTANQSNTTELWHMAGDDRIDGKGITQKNKKGMPDFIEFLSIQKIGNAIFYSAKPPQNEFPVSFKLTECSSSYLQFENKTHDFPQLIKYHKVSETKIKVEVKDKNDKGFEINFERASTLYLSQRDIVFSYVDAYNQKDLVAMMKHTDDNIHWMSINGKTISIETKNRDELERVLKQHFSRARKSHSSLSAVVESGSFVSAIEKSTSIKSGKESSACSLSVYEFSRKEDQTKQIVNVWYYPAEKCE